MSKIFINNFPNPTQSVQLSKLENDALMGMIVGFDFKMPKNDLKKKIATDLISALLTHDTISIRTKRVLDIIGCLGYQDTSILLQSGCIELVDDNGLTFPLLQGKNGNNIGSIRDADINDNLKSLDWVEKRLFELEPTNKELNNAILVDMQKANYEIDSDSIAMRVIDELNYDLKNANLTDALGLASPDRNTIHENDFYKALRLAHINSSIIYASDLNSNDILIEGGVEQILPLKVSPALDVSKKPATELFQNLTNAKGIPALSDLFLSGIITLEEIIKIRENFNGKKFRKWLEDVNYQEDEVTKALMNNTPGIKAKGLRFLVTNTIGLINPVAGIVTSAVDSFIVDKLLNSWHPNFFLDDILGKQIDGKISQFESQKRVEYIRSKFANSSRNDLCPCGSGKKFKRCHGK